MNFRPINYAAVNLNFSSINILLYSDSISDQSVLFKPVGEFASMFQSKIRAANNSLN